MLPRRTCVGLGLLVLAGVEMSADVLVLRNGRRVQGVLVGVRGETLEFEEDDGRGRRVVRVDRDEVDRIEFDDRGRPGSPFGGGDRPPRGTRERVVSVAAAAPWTDTGVDVRSGQTVFFQAEGRVRWGPDRRDGPGGESGSPRNPARPIPNRPAAALIGRVDQGDAFFIGADTSAMRIRGSGRLYLGINDDYLADNSGSFRVTIFY